MENHKQWRLFNIDSLIQKMKGEAPDGPTIDLYVASLAFKRLRTGPPGLAVFFQTTSILALKEE